MDPARRALPKSEGLLTFDPRGRLAVAGWWLRTFVIAFTTTGQHHRAHDETQQEQESRFHYSPEYWYRNAFTPEAVVNVSKNLLVFNAFTLPSANATAPMPTL